MRIQFGLDGQPAYVAQPFQANPHKRKRYEMELDFGVEARQQQQRVYKAPTGQPGATDHTKGIGKFRPAVQEFFFQKSRPDPLKVLREDRYLANKAHMDGAPLKTI
jgi:hypothetical protein